MRVDTFMKRVKKLEEERQSLLNLLAQFTMQHHRIVKSHGFDFDRCYCNLCQKVWDWGKKK